MAIDILKRTKIAWDVFIGKNTFNQAFYQFTGGAFTTYDRNGKNYLEKGYNSNPDVFSCINQMVVKTLSVPYEVKKINEEKVYKKLKQFNLATKGDFNFLQKIKLEALRKKAYTEDDIPFPLEKPNETQTWADVWGLYKTYIKLTGNCYFYILSTKDGANKGVPVQLYVLPAHLMQIVLKLNANMLGTESPIDYYMLIEGHQYIKFDVNDIIHIKYSNPNFDLQGAHLYGMSPLHSALKNIQSQNEAIDLNIKTLQNGGAFGFIHAKNGQSPLTQTQADSLKERLIEMDNNPDRLSRIAGTSAEVGFTRISLTADELKPFDYLNWDRKTICNVLGWYDELLNSDGKVTLGGVKIGDIQKQAITSNILPDLILLQDSLNKHFIPKFKGYENTEIEWDICELPEMQENMTDLVDWLNKSPITPNEFRTAIKYETLPDDGMDVVWIANGKARIDDVSAGIIQSNP